MENKELSREELLVLQKKMEEANDALNVKLGEEIVLRRELQSELAGLRTMVANERHLRACMLTGLMHELRAPLCGISGLAEVLKQNSLNDANSQPILEEIIKAARNIRNVLEDVLATSRAEQRNCLPYEQN